jgi:hypothetical protein
MSEERENNEKESVNQLRPKHKRNIRGYFDGTLLTRETVIKQLPYILFLAVIAIIYIGNRYQAEKIIRETYVLQREVKDLRAESISISSDLMYISKQSEVLKMVKEKGLDLIESREPPKIIEVNN